jgi:hypothetical protein
MSPQLLIVFSRCLDSPSLHNSLLFASFPSPNTLPRSSHFSTLCIIPLLLVRFFSDKVALLVDQFGLDHFVPRFRWSVRIPSRLGTAFTLAFVPLASLVGYSVVSQNPRVRASALVPTSAFTARAGSACDGAAVAYETTIRIQVVAFIESGRAGPHLGWVSPALGDFGAGTFRAVSATAGDGVTLAPVAARLPDAVSGVASSNNGTTASLVLECERCSIGAASRLRFHTSWATAAIEWRLFVAGAEAGSGVTVASVLTSVSAAAAAASAPTPGPGFKSNASGSGPSALLPAATTLGFSLTPSRFLDLSATALDAAAATDPCVTKNAVNLGLTVGAGYELAFTSATEDSPPPALVNEATQAQLTFVFNPGDIVYLQTITLKQGPLQLALAIITALTSVLGIWRLVFTSAERFIPAKLLGRPISPPAAAPAAASAHFAAGDGRGTVGGASAAGLHPGAAMRGAGRRGSFLGDLVQHIQQQSSESLVERTAEAMRAGGGADEGALLHQLSARLLAMEEDQRADRARLRALEAVLAVGRSRLADGAAQLQQQLQLQQQPAANVPALTGAGVNPIWLPRSNAAVVRARKGSDGGVEMAPPITLHAARPAPPLVRGSLAGGPVVGHPPAVPRGSIAAGAAASQLYKPLPLSMMAGVTQMAGLDRPLQTITAPAPPAAVAVAGAGDSVRIALAVPPVASALLASGSREMRGVGWSQFQDKDSGRPYWCQLDKKGESVNGTTTWVDPFTDLVNA